MSTGLSIESIPNKNLVLAQELLADAADQLKQLQHQRKTEEQPSPGLLDAIKRLELKRDNLMETVSLWRTFLREYPSYDR